MNLIKKALFKDRFNKVSEEASVQSNWEQNDSNANDYIKNRPFYDYKSFDDIYWDGDTTDKIIIEFIDEEGYDQKYCRVSDLILTSNELSNVEYIFRRDGVDNRWDFSDEQIIEYDSGSVTIGKSSAPVISIAVDNDTVKVYGKQVTFPNSGIYFLCYRDGSYIKQLIPSIISSHIGEKYLPNSVINFGKILGEEYAYKILATDEYGTIVTEDRDIIRDDNISTGQILDLPKGMYYFKNTHEVYGTNGQYFLLNGLCQISDLGNNYKLFTLYDYGMKYRIDNNKAIVDTTPIYNQDIDYIINSSTEGSTKKFKITVDDSGTISATEVV